MTYKLETVLLGGLTALMILTNGQLSKVYGNAGSNVIIHFIGLGGCLIWYLVRYKNKPNMSSHQAIGIFEISGGLIGYLTVWLTNASFLGMGVAATLAVAIAGQTLFAAMFDQFGLLGVSKRTLTPLEYFSIILTLLGAGLLSIGGQ